MTVQLSTAVRNARADAAETTIGPSAVLMLRTGEPPENCAASDTGTVVATLELPSDWMANADNGSKAMQGDWKDDAADAAGTVGHFRIYASDGTTCHMQGTVTQTGGGGDMELDNVVLAQNQAFSITQFAWTEGNA